MRRSNFKNGRILQKKQKGAEIKVCLFLYFEEKMNNDLRGISVSQNGLISLDVEKLTKKEKRSYGVGSLNLTSCLQLEMEVSYDRGEPYAFGYNVNQINMGESLLMNFFMEVDETNKDLNKEFKHGEEVVNVKVLKKAFETTDFIVVDGRKCQTMSSKLIDEAIFLKDNPLGIALRIITEGFFLKEKDGEYELSLEEPKEGNYKEYEVFGSSSSKIKGAGSYAINKAFKIPAAAIESYNSSIREQAGSLTGAEAFLVYITNGYFLTLKNSGSKENLAKFMARIGLLLSGGNANDISKLKWKFQQLGSVELPIEEALPALEKFAVGRKKGDICLKNMISFYKSIKGDGQCYIKASAYAKFLKEFQVEHGSLETLKRKVVGRAFIGRLNLQLKNEKGETGFAMCKGLFIPVPDSLMNELYGDVDVVLTAETTKVNSLTDGYVARTLLQVCQETEEHGSNTTNSQALNNLEGDISTKAPQVALGDVESFLLGDNGIASSYINKGLAGLENAEDAIAFLGLFKGKSKQLTLKKYESFAKKALEIGGDLSRKSPSMRAAYLKAFLTKIDKMSYGKIPFDGQFMVIMQDHSSFFPKKERLVDTGKVIFGRPVYDIQLKLDDLILQGAMDGFCKKVFGERIMIRNPIQMPDQVAKINFVENIDELVKAKGYGQDMLELFKKTQGVICSSTGLIDTIVAGDYDGDIAQLYFDERGADLIASGRTMRLPTNSADAPLKEEVTLDNIKDQVVNSFASDMIGWLSNVASVIQDIKLNIFGGYELQPAVIKAINFMVYKAEKKANKMTDDYEFASTVKLVSKMKINDPTSMVRAFESCLHTLSSLTMREIDKAKTGVGVDINDFQYMVPAYMVNNGERNVSISVVPNWLKPAVNIKKGVTPLKEGCSTESQFRKTIYQSMAPLGKLERYIDNVSKGLSKKLSSMDLGEMIFPMPKDEALTDLFVESAEEYSINADTIMDQYAEDKEMRQRTLSELTAKHRYFWIEKLNNGELSEKELCGLMDALCLVSQSNRGSHWEKIYGAEVLGEIYLEQLKLISKSVMSQCITVKWISNGFNNKPGLYTIVKDQIVDSEGLVIGRPSQGVPDGEYEIKKVAGEYYIATKKDVNDPNIGKSFRVFGTKELGLEAKDIAEKIKEVGSVQISKGIGSTAVTCGDLKINLEDNSWVIGGSSFKVEVIDYKGKSVYLRVIKTL